MYVQYHIHCPVTFGAERTDFVGLIKKKHLSQLPQQESNSVQTGQRQNKTAKTAGTDGQINLLKSFAPSL